MAHLDVDPTHKDIDELRLPPLQLPFTEQKGILMDLHSRLLKDRIIMLGRYIDEQVANVIVSQFLYLATEKPKQDITLYINCAGGELLSSLSIFDVISSLPCPINTICYGTASSVGAFLLASGTKGKRKAYPSAKIMLHQPLAGAKGQASDIELQAKEILYHKSVFNTYLSHLSGQSLDRIEKDSNRDFLLTAKQTIEQV
jgi:ATP-dependent Clp protease protease subunit